MSDTATPETGPVDAPASVESIVAELNAGGEAPASDAESIAQELVNEAEGAGGEPSETEEPAPEEEATEPAEAPAEPEAEAPEQEQSYTVKVNGEERQVPLSELLNGYSRTEDYKAKTAAVAEERRQIEQQRSTIDVELKSQYASQLEQATSLFAQFDPVLAEARNLNWEALKQQDPAAYVQAQDAVNQRLTAIQQMQRHFEQLRGETQQAQQQQLERERAERFDRAASKIVEAMPELADEAKFTDFAKSAVGYLQNQGFEQAEIADALDERVLALADKARKWDAHVAAQQNLPAKRVVPQSVVKPLTTNGDSSRATSARFPSRGSRETKVDWVTQAILAEE